MVAQRMEWVLLSYRVPRQPSTPRIAIWRRLKDLGVVSVVDGLVGLPNDDRNRELLQWTAGQVHEAGGEAIVWTGVALQRSDDERLRSTATEARAEEYRALLAEIDDLGPTTDRRTIDRLRRSFRRIDRRDHFGAPLRDEARMAVAELARPTSGDRRRDGAANDDIERNRR